LGGGDDDVLIVVSSWADLQDITFKALPAVFGLRATTADNPAAAAAGIQHVCGKELEQAADRLCSLLQGLLQLLQESTSDGGVVMLPQLPVLEALTVITSSSSQQQPQQEVDADAKSLWQQHTEQMLAAGHKLRSSAGANDADADAGLQQQQQEAEALMTHVLQLRRAFTSDSTSSVDPQGAVDRQLQSIQQELQHVQQLLGQAVANAEGQQLLLQVFAEFASQLEHQGVLAGRQPSLRSSSSSSSGAKSGVHDSHMLVELLQQFLEVNPHVPQMVAAHLTPAAVGPPPHDLSCDSPLAESATSMSAATQVGERVEGAASTGWAALVVCYSCG
jgi:hypothetical protein